MELGLGRCKQVEKCLRKGGILDLIESAIEVKYVLKELETAVGSEVTLSSILKEIGFGVFGALRDIISLTPCQIF